MMTLLDGLRHDAAALAPSRFGKHGRRFLVPILEHVQQPEIIVGVGQRAFLSALASLKIAGGSADSSVNIASLQQFKGSFEPAVFVIEEIECLLFHPGSEHSPSLYSRG